jgi:hypothetical protein
MDIEQGDRFTGGLGFERNKSHQTTTHKTLNIRIFLRKHIQHILCPIGQLHKSGMGTRASSGKKERRSRSRERR